MPILLGHGAIAADEGVRGTASVHTEIVTALEAWRVTQGIYRFDPDLLLAIVDTPLDGMIPTEHFQRLPEWCCYIELADTDMRLGEQKMHGAWVHIEYDMVEKQAEFRAIYDVARDPRQPFAQDGLCCAPPLVLAGDMRQALDELVAACTESSRKAGLSPTAEIEDYLRMHMEDLRDLISIALYLCTDADMMRDGTVTRPETSVMRRRDINRQRDVSAPVMWDVGVRIGAALRAAYAHKDASADVDATGRHVRPHIRRGHWHTVLSGKRINEDGSAIHPDERHRELRWRPPVAVNLNDTNELPATVRRVQPSWKPIGKRK